MKKNKKEIGMITAGIVLIALSVAVIAYNCYFNVRAAQSIQSVMPAAEQILAGYNEASQTYMQAGENFGSSELCEPPCVEINGNAYIGVLEIPCLGLVLPILSEYGTKNLDIAPRGSNDPTKLIIEGKNYASHFGKLNLLSAGDDIMFTDFLGRVYKYRVSKSDTVPKCEKIKNLSEGYNLTLVCHADFGLKRFVVYCDRI